MTIDELTAGHRCHFDASVHVGGHPGEDWPEHKVMVLTRDRQTWFCTFDGTTETVVPVGSVREGLERFAGELPAAIADLPARPGAATADTAPATR